MARQNVVLGPNNGSFPLGFPDFGVKKSSHTQMLFDSGEFKQGAVFLMQGRSEKRDSASRPVFLMESEGFFHQTESKRKPLF